MQDRYAGDVGDFGKFSLLRTLSEAIDSRLGVVWYRFPDESHNGDGRHVDYINKPQYSACDKELVMHLSKVVYGERSVAHLEQLNILPNDTVYFSEILDFHLIYPTQTKTDKAERRIGRLRWLADAVKAVEKSKIIFVDPDNGLEVKSTPNIYQMKSGKYTYISELQSLFNGKDICVIYHHLNRNEKHEVQIHNRAQQLKSSIPGIERVFALRFWPYSPRAFFICASADSSSSIKNIIKDYYSGACNFGWDIYNEL